MGGRCERCRRRSGARRLVAAIAVVACLVGTAAAAVASARNAPPQGSGTRRGAITDAHAYAEEHPCDSKLLGRALARLEAYDAPLEVRTEVLRVHLAATCPPMTAQFDVDAFHLAMDARDLPLARAFADRTLQVARTDDERWIAYQQLEALGFALQDDRVVRFAREGFQTIRPTAAIAGALSKDR